MTGRALADPPKGVLSGDLATFGPFDIAQTLMAGRKTARITLVNGQRRGTIQFRDGSVVAATDDDLNTGERAAFNLFLWTAGTFTIEFDRPPGEVNIRTDTQNLLLEVARHLDETRREDPAGAETDVAARVGERIEDQLKNRLNAIFTRMARRAEPSRARFSVTAFDALLVALADLGGSALFIRPDERPRVKATGGFATLKDDPVTDTEIEGFLGALLSEKERGDLREFKETHAWYTSPDAGTFRVEVLDDHGRVALIFHPARREIPGAAALGLLPADVARIEAARSGLILLAGGPAAPASAALACLLDQCLATRPVLACLFSGRAGWAFTGESGILVRRDTERLRGGLAHGIGDALVLGADVLAVDGLVDPSSLVPLASAARSGRLVLATVDAVSERGVLAFLRRAAETGEPGPFLRSLAEVLCCAFLLEPPRDGRSGAAGSATAILAGADLHDLLAAGRLEDLDRALATPAPVPA